MNVFEYDWGTRGRPRTVNELTAEQRYYLQQAIDNLVHVRCLGGINLDGHNEVNAILCEAFSQLHIAPGSGMSHNLVSLRRQISRRLIKVSPTNSRHRELPPLLGEFIICMFVLPEKQQDRLGDFEERFTNLWLPRFGRRLAGVLYIAHALRSAAAVVRIATIAAAMDRIWRAWGWLRH